MNGQKVYVVSQWCVNGLSACFGETKEAVAVFATEQEAKDYVKSGAGDSYEEFVVGQPAE